MECWNIFDTSVTKHKNFNYICIIFKVTNHYLIRMIKFGSNGLVNDTQVYENVTFKKLDNQPHINYIFL